MHKSAALEKLIRQLDLSRNINRGQQTFTEWSRNTELAIEYIFGKDTRHLKDFQDISYSPSSFNMYDPEPDYQRAFQSGMDVARAVLQSMISEVTEYWPDVEEVPAIPPGPLSRIELICRKFHLVARQLRSRHDNRSTLDISDEYDVQDLMHALLRVDFEDVRAEEWTPSYAGKHARMDLLLKRERIVVELKKASRTLATSKIGDQLIVDVARYAMHPGVDGSSVSSMTQKDSLVTLQNWSQICRELEMAWRFKSSSRLRHELRNFALDCSITSVSAERLLDSRPTWEISMDSFGNLTSCTALPWWCVADGHDRTKQVLSD
jgi:hypothetical protein